MKAAYEATLQQAIEGGDDEIARHIRSNMRIVESMEKYEFDIKKDFEPIFVEVFGRRYAEHCLYGN